MPKKFDVSVHQLTVWEDSLIEFLLKSDFQL